MKNLFSYDNKFMQMLMTIGDLIILNVLFILCSIPIVTMGAAQAGLYTAVRVITDKDDDSSPVAGFFRGFKTGFLKITLVWIVFMVLIVSSLWAFFGATGGVKIVAAIAFCIVAIYEMLVMMFHARFDCTPLQLLKNSTLMLLAHPIRVIPAAFLSWLTVLIMLYDPYSFMAIGVIILSLFISLCYFISYALLHKPFQDLVKMANEKLGITDQGEDAEETEAETEEVTEE